MSNNFLSQPFKPYVKAQVEARQKALGKYSNISPSILQYYTTKAPWIRLASSINVTSIEDNNSIVYQKLIDSGLTPEQIKDENLAKNFVLQGGSISITNNIQNTTSNGLNSGLNSTNQTFKGAYGWGGIEERGYVPMPGITNVSVNYQNNGALTKTTINIKCYSKAQFKLVDTLYLRPGYSLLLEFGHSVYLNEDLDLQSFDNFSTSPLRTLFNSGEVPFAIANQFSMYKMIENERATREGNYEAVFGMIHNFNWTFNSDGSYDCIVQLTGMGDVIESLKMNIPSPNNGRVYGGISTLTDIALDAYAKETPFPPIIANRSKTYLDSILYDIYQDINTDFRILSDFTVKGFVGSHNNFQPKNLNIPNAILSISGVKTDSETDSSRQNYMTFGTLLALLQTHLLLYDFKGSSKAPITEFDFNFENLDKDENVITKLPGQFSSDPLTCLIPYESSPILVDAPSPESDINFNLNEGASWSYSPYLGRLANIYVNFNFISRVLSSKLEGEDKTLSVLSFLKSIIGGIQSSLGGFNKIKVILSSIDNKIKFYDEIPQRLPEETERGEYTKFNTFGVEEGIEGSFITNINLNGNISQNLSNMIAIGAASSATQLAGDSTALANYNLGLEDRVIPQRSSDDLGNTRSEPGIESPKDDLRENYVKNINPKENSIFESIYKDKLFNLENITALSSFNKLHAKLLFGILSKNDSNQQLQAPSFLPFDLSLEMDGLSGMVLYQKFLINDKILPPSYERDGVDIQLKGINHEVNNSGWTTKLNTISVPSSKLAPPLQPLSPTQTDLQNPMGSPSPLSSNVPPPPTLESVDRFNAMQDSYNYVFNTQGQAKGMCARWTYNLALNYTKYLKKEIPLPQIPAGGNANNNIAYYTNLEKLGYSKTKSVFTKSQLIESLNTTTWGYGDIVAYWCNDGPTNQSHVKYGHTQIYVGGINSTKWATSLPLNYGANFIYNSRIGNNWTYYIFRAPAQ